METTHAGMLKGYEMQLVATDIDGVLVVRVNEARIDAAASLAFKEAMRVIIADAQGRVILDLAGVDFVDSSGLGAVVAVMKLLHPDRRLELAGLSPAVQKVFALTRMDRVFTIHPPLAEAGPLPLAS